MPPGVRGKPQTYTRPPYSVTVECDGKIFVKPGDWLSKYSWAIYGNYTIVDEQGRDRFAEWDGQKSEPRPIRNKDLIKVGDILVHLETYDKHKNRPPIRPGPRIFNRQNVVDYARRFAENPNPKYEVAGNDCTNFVSQCLAAGGWTMVHRTIDDADHQDKSVWWYGKRTARFWRELQLDLVQRQYFHDFLLRSGRGKQVTDFMTLRPGDVVQIKGERVYHTMIVTEVVPKRPGDLKLCYHSDNKKDELLSDVRGAIPRFETFIYWQISDAKW